MKGGRERKDNDESGKISETRHWVKVKWRLRIGMGQRQRRDKSRLSTVYMYENEAICPQRQSQQSLCQRSIMSRFLSNDRTNRSVDKCGHTHTHTHNDQTNRSVEEKLAEVRNMRLSSWVASFCLILRSPLLHHYHCHQFRLY